MSPCFRLGMELHFQGEDIRVVFPSRPLKDRSLEVAMGVSLGTCVHVLSVDMDALVSDPVHLFILAFISA